MAMHISSTSAATSSQVTSDHGRTEPVLSPHQQPQTAPSPTSSTRAEVRSGLSNLKRFYASLNCLHVKREPVNIDITTQEGLVNYKTSVATWVDKAGEADERISRERIAARISQWLTRNEPGTELNLSGLRSQSVPPLPSTLQALNLSDQFQTGTEYFPKVWPVGLTSLNLSNIKFFTTPPIWPNRLTRLNLSENKIYQPPSNLPVTLTHLDLSANLLSHLPQLPTGLVDLNISNNRFGMLPQALPQRLARLDVSANSLAVLPTLPGALKWLDASGNHLVSLQENLPAQLLSLQLSHNALTCLPPRLPAGLITLNVAGNQIHVLPNQLPATLNRLQVASNPLRSLPPLPDRLAYLSASYTPLENLGPLPDSLRTLDVSDTALNQLPANLPPGLASLRVRNNQRLTSLPGRLPEALIRLDISHTRIAHVTPNLRQAMSRLRNPCVVSAEGCPAWAQISIQSNRLGIGNLNAYQVGRQSLSLHQAVQAWYRDVNQNRETAWKEIHATAQEVAYRDPTVPFWALLDSLKGCAEYPKEASDTASDHMLREQMRAAFRDRVTFLLDEIVENPSLRKTCFKIADDAVETCHDRVALGFEEMELEHLTLRAGRGEFAPLELARLGRGFFKLSLLDKLAEAKAITLGLAHELVEVILAYRTRLAVALDLPVKTKDMQYFGTSRLTDLDLAQAQEHVGQAVSDHNILHFLSAWAPWQKDLERRWPERFVAPRAALQRQQEALTVEVNALFEEHQEIIRRLGSDSEPALAAHARMHLVKIRYDALENMVLGPARELLTQEFMAQRTTD